MRRIKGNEASRGVMGCVNRGGGEARRFGERIVCIEGYGVLFFVIGLLS